MSDHCRHCRYRRRGRLSVPTLYWDFLARHQARFARSPRMRYAYPNLARKDPDELAAIRRRGDEIKLRLT
jgi:deoxyribodipyrimidine photolyase-related protein